MKKLTHFLYQLGGCVQSSLIKANQSKIMGLPRFDGQCDKARNFHLSEFLAIGSGSEDPWDDSL
jgi:hypothetical protein